jgi:hypothetical protein
MDYRTASTSQTALPLLLGETTFSYQHPPTLLRRKTQFIDAQSTATVRCSPLGGGMPKWIDGKADTDCIATRDAMVAVIDRSGRLYVSRDDGAAWSNPIDGLPAPLLGDKRTLGHRETGAFDLLRKSLRPLTYA